MLADRLKKRARHLKKWARRRGVSCYRLYDRDIPEIPLAIDWYEGRLHVAEYLRRGVERPASWAEAMAAAAAQALGVPSQAVWLKRRVRQRGRAQYDKVAALGQRFTVCEGGLRFLVNLGDYLDTGLFLDHRELRAMVAAEAHGKDVLNLFAYTGAFSVYAAAAGARSTTTVDLSNTYLGWAADNLALNGFPVGDRHRLLRADVLQWLGEAPAGRWDHVVVDPPTFSTSKKMAGTLDVQRDHVGLLQGARRLLRPGGILWFSTNQRTFKPVPEAFAGLRPEEISARTVPEDFRNKRIHRAWRLARA